MKLNLAVNVVDVEEFRVNVKVDKSIKSDCGMGIKCCINVGWSCI